MFHFVNNYFYFYREQADFSLSATISALKYNWLPMTMYCLFNVYIKYTKLHYHQLSVWIFIGCPEIVTRGDWGAQVPKSSKVMKVPVSHVFIHHTAGAKCNSKDSCMKVARQIQNYHMNNNSKYRNFVYITREYSIKKNSTLYVLRVIYTHKENISSIKRLIYWVVSFLSCASWNMDKRTRLKNDCFSLEKICFVSFYQKMFEDNTSTTAFLFLFVTPPALYILYHISCTIYKCIL